MSNETTDYPLLTIELLAGLRKKIEAMRTTRADCELIDHYLTCIGRPGYLRNHLLFRGIITYDDITQARLENPNNPWDATPYQVTGCLLGCLNMLRRRLLRGEKIY